MLAKPLVLRETAPEIYTDKEKGEIKQCETGDDKDNDKGKGNDKHKNKAKQTNTKINTKINTRIGLGLGLGLGLDQIWKRQVYLSLTLF
jgi:hypothetical protein